MSRKIREEIFDRLKGERIIDSHNHVWDNLNFYIFFTGISQEQQVKKGDIDLITLIKDSYMKHDFVSAGLDVVDSDLLLIDPEGCWEMFSPFLKKVMNTTFSRIFSIALKDLYGIEKLSANNWKEASETIGERSSEKGWKEYVLRERCRLDFGIIDHVWDVADFHVDRRFFRPLLRIDPFVLGWSPEYRDFFGNSPWEIGRRWDMPLDDFDDYLALIDEGVKRCTAAGGVSLKVGLAYNRTLEVSNPSREDAEKAFGRTAGEVAAGEAKAFEDFIINYFVNKAAEEDVQIHIHTGFLGGVGKAFPNSNPTQLFSLIVRNPEASFVILHGGYPYTREAGAMAKVFPNVYLELSFLNIVCQSAFERSLAEWLDEVPGNKFIWGTDVHNPEEIYAAASLSKESLSRVLARKVERGDISSDSAVKLGKGILRDNMLELIATQKKYK